MTADRAQGCPVSDEPTEGDAAADADPTADGDPTAEGELPADGGAAALDGAAALHAASIDAAMRIATVGRLVSRIGTSPLGWAGSFHREGNEAGSGLARRAPRWYMPGVATPSVMSPKRTRTVDPPIKRSGNPRLVASAFT